MKKVPLDKHVRSEVCLACCGCVAGLRCVRLLAAGGGWGYGAAGVDNEPACKNERTFGGRDGVFFMPMREY